MSLVGMNQTENKHIVCLGPISMLNFYQSQHYEISQSEIKCDPTNKKLWPKAFLFLFVGLHHLPHFDFGKSKKKKKKITCLRKCV